MKSFLPLMSLLAGWAGAAEPVMVAHPEVDCQPDATIVWTAAMQTAFDRLLGAEGAMPVEKVNPENAVITRMKAFAWTRDEVLPKDGWFAEAGLNTPKLAQDATAKWRALAGPEAKEFTPPPTSGQRTELAAYAGIRRNFDFTRAFTPSGDHRLEWGEAREPVRFFGTGGKEAAKYQGVHILAHRAEDKMMALQFSAKDVDDTMILYMPKAGQSMAKAIATIHAWRTTLMTELRVGRLAAARRLIEEDELRVPAILLATHQDLTASFAGELVLKGAAQPGRVTGAMTDMNLEVSATGVKFSSTATMGGRGGVTPKKREPRRFWFDKPFFLFLWREKAEHPYAAVWFGDSKGLVK